MHHVLQHRRPFTTASNFYFDRIPQRRDILFNNNNTSDVFIANFSLMPGKITPHNLNYFFFNWFSGECFQLQYKESTAEESFTWRMGIVSNNAPIVSQDNRGITSVVRMSLMSGKMDRNKFCKGNNKYTSGQVHPYLITQHHHSSLFI